MLYPDYFDSGSDDSFAKHHFNLKVNQNHYKEHPGNEKDMK